MVEGMEVKVEQRVSRGFHLNGWQRIGIVLSVVWAIGTWWSLYVAPIVKSYSRCERLNDFENCWHLVDVQRASQLSYMGLVIAVAALLPIPIAWLIVYGLIGLVRWIRVVFKRA
jgi:hypothetical protein